jgi:uncharacterized protein (DUF2235 family)
MSKKIAYCADGTWDTSASNSNVYRLFKALPTTADQVPYYDDGVGSDGTPIEKLLGGAFGEGLFQKIRDGYTKIAHAWNPGDEIFVFGFSRGAYTARSLAGMIAVCGLPGTSSFTDDVIKTAFAAYRDKTRRDQLLASLKDYKMTNATIRMVGVWDTVGSLGIPAIFGGVDTLRYSFLDTSLHPDVINAYQALAIDERRSEFPPTLWTTQAPGQTVDQVWFTGVHGDVGGGYPDDKAGTALSDITLGWMLAKAAALGLAIDPGVAKQLRVPLDAKLALDTKHESWNVAWLFPKHRMIDAEAVLANSVSVRCVHDPTYRPSNLSFTGGALANSYPMENVVSEAPGQTAAAGQ